MALTARDNPSQPIFPKFNRKLVSLLQICISVFIHYFILCIIEPNEKAALIGVSQSTATLRPSTAATSSQVLSAMQHRSTKGQSIGVGSLSSSQRPMSATERAEELKNKAAKANSLSRAMKMEAQAAEENKKKQTVPRAPNFASDSRASKRFLAKVANTPVQP